MTDPADYLRLAKAVVARTPRRPSPDWLDREDLEQEACLGLCEAAARYRSNPRLAFTSYAWARCRHRVLDALRAAHPINRHTWGEIGRMHAGAPFSAAKTAGLRRAERAIREQHLTDLDLRKRPGRAPTALEDAMHAERAEAVAHAIVSLPETERRVIIGYYFEFRGQGSLGAELGVTRSRVCQIHRKALGRLQRRHDELIARLDARARAGIGRVDDVAPAAGVLAVHLARLRHLGLVRVAAQRQGAQPRAPPGLHGAPQMRQGLRRQPRVHVREQQHGQFLVAQVQRRADPHAARFGQPAGPEPLLHGLPAHAHPPGQFVDRHAPRLHQALEHPSRVFHDTSPGPVLGAV